MFHFSVTKDCVGIYLLAWEFLDCVGIYLLKVIIARSSLEFFVAEPKICIRDQSTFRMGLECWMKKCFFNNLFKNNLLKICFRDRIFLKETLT